MSRNLKPILTISEFSGSGDGNLLYNEGFLPEVINGKSIMTTGLISETKLGAGSLYQSLNLGNIVANVNLVTLDSNSNKFSLFLNTSGKIFTDSTDEDEVKPAEIHDYTSNNYPDIFELENNNLIYTGTQYLGKGIRGQATGGSATTIVDSGKDFTALGITTGDKVTNLRTGWEYTITAISGAGNTTLEFTAAGSLVNAANDEYIVWNDNALDLLNTVSAETWQPQTISWRRQIKQYGDQYYILNGNYLAKLSADGTTLDDAYKQLPARNQALAFDVNNAKILVSAEYKNRGNLLLWDGTTDGWQNIVDWDFPINAIVAYKSGWLFMSQGTLYYTDGYSIEELTTIDSRVDIDAAQIGYLEPTYFNGLYYNNKKLYFANSYNDSNLVHNGVYMYDFKNGWTLIPQTRGENILTLGGTPYSIFYLNYEKNIGVGGAGFVNEIKSNSTYNSSKINYSFLYYIDLPSETQITAIGLNILRPIKEFLNDSGIKQTTIAVNIGDGGRGLIDNVFNNADGSAANKLKLNGTSFYNNEVGDELYVIEPTSDENDYGKRFYITDITNKGETTEEWTLSDDIGTDFRGNLKMIRVKKLDKRTIYSNELNKEFLFSNPRTGFLSNKLFIEIVVWDSFDYTPMPISISDIKIYGN